MYCTSTSMLALAVKICSLYNKNVLSKACSILLHTKSYFNISHFDVTAKKYYILERKLCLSFEMI